MKIFGNGKTHKGQIITSENNVDRYLAFTIKDEKANSFNLPIFFNNTDLAVRAFSDILLNPATVVSKHPQDFTLYQLGTFNDLNGQITPFENLIRVIRADELFIAIKQNSTQEPVNETINR